MRSKTRVARLIVPRLAYRSLKVMRVTQGERAVSIISRTEMKRELAGWVRGCSRASNGT